MLISMHEGDDFSAKTLWNDWPGHGPAGRFWLLESARSSRLTNVLRNVNRIAAACSPFEKNRPAMFLTM